MGMSLDSNWAEPKTDTDEDRKAVELYMQTHVSFGFEHVPSYIPLIRSIILFLYALLSTCA